MDLLRKPKASLLLSIGLLNLFLGVFILSCGGVSNTPRDTVQNFVDALKKKQGKAAFHNFVEKGDSVLAEVWEENWDEFDKWLETLEDIEFEILSVSEDGDVATVTLRITQKDGEEIDTDEMELKLINGRWKIAAEAFR